MANQVFGLEAIEFQLASHRTSPHEFGFDLSEDYFENVSGSQNLYMTGKTESAFDLCLMAARKLLAARPHLSSQLDAVLVVTLPTEPTVAPISSRLQGALGLPTNTFCLDFTASCVGFLQASSLALEMMKSRGWKNLLLLNVDTLTKIMRPNDAPLRLIFSDGATASLISDQAKILFQHFDFFVDGTKAGILEARDGIFQMDGPAVYETVLRSVPRTFRECLEKFALSHDTVDLFLFHQASKRVLDRLGQMLELDEAKMPFTIQDVGNLGSASLPHMLSEILQRPLKPKMKMFATAFGAGFQWAHASLEAKD